MDSLAYQPSKEEFAHGEGSISKLAFANSVPSAVITVILEGVIRVFGYVYEKLFLWQVPVEVNASVRDRVYLRKRNQRTRSVQEPVVRFHKYNRPAPGTHHDGPGIILIQIFLRADDGSTHLTEPNE